MYDPLGLIRDKRLMLKLCRRGESHTYKAVGHTFTTDSSSTRITRYSLQDQNGENEIELEVVKDSANNFHICTYELIEMRDFSSTLLSILGTETIGFIPQNRTALTNRLYHRLLAEDERLETCKYLCDAADLNDLPENLGYTRDGNGHWYMMMTRSGGREKRFHRRPPKLCWEYEDQKGGRLLIELNAASKKAESFFEIYLGRSIVREELQIVGMPGKRYIQAAHRHETSFVL
ncbi:MAG TPA: hypothetical protein ENK93_05655 [Campylobacteraceae bacterium]|jgi:hypothetical protein|nr:hypothetical protein [Campylobacteraceae bacterium]HHH36984.1 hypothetical protein [Campylobacterota bacterium]